jgi:hypothetical protein
MANGSKKSVKEIEEQLTYLAKNDLNNPEIYELLKQLAAIYIYQNKFVYGYSDVEAVCHDVAADTYMRLLSGRTEITQWIYYIGKSIKFSYIEQQRRIEHEVIETEYNPESDNRRLIDRSAVISMCAGSSKSFNQDFNAVHKVTFLENIDSLIREAMSKIKYKKESKEYLTLYMNVCLTLFYDKPTYFRINPELKPYVMYIVAIFRELFTNSDFIKDVYDEEDEDLPSLIFYDEQLVKDTDRRRDI